MLRPTIELNAEPHFRPGKVNVGDQPRTLENFPVQLGLVSRDPSQLDADGFKNAVGNLVFPFMFGHKGP